MDRRPSALRRPLRFALPSGLWSVFLAGCIAGCILGCVGCGASPANTRTATATSTPDVPPQAAVYGVIASGEGELGLSGLAAAASTCHHGMVAIEGVCCWPGQTLKGGLCGGAPSACPPGYEVLAEADACVSTACPEGTVRLEDGAPCCWPGQSWSDASRACQGRPSCPNGSRVAAQGTTSRCEPVGDNLTALIDACSTENTTACDDLARARLAALTPQWTVYTQQTLPNLRQATAPRQIKHTLQVAAAAVSELSAGYLAIVKQPGPVSQHTLEAATMYGRVFDELALAVLAIASPVQLTSEQSDIFQQMLGEQAQPLFGRAAEGYTKAVELAAAAGLDGVHLQHAQARLAALATSAP